MSRQTAFALASDFTCLATFFGLLAAGVAAALQSVILSTVGYFVLVGRRGIRIGDRIQIAGVTGDVTDIGCLQFQLKEIDIRTQQPTGNVVSFSNSFVLASPSDRSVQVEAERLAVEARIASKFRTGRQLAWSRWEGARFDKFVILRKPYNKAAFTVPVSGQGNLSRNALRGFNASQVDFTLQRLFKLSERFALQTSADFFNIFNHPNFGAPVNYMTSPQFGFSTQTLNAWLGSGGQRGGLNPLYQIGGPRSIQLALKLQF